MGSSPSSGSLSWRAELVGFLLPDVSSPRYHLFFPVSGASVISTRCSETYETKTALLSLFGIPLWYHSQSPRVILQVGTQ